MQISRRCSRRSIEQFFRIFAGEPNRRERNSFSREELRETNYSFIEQGLIVDGRKRLFVSSKMGGSGMLIVPGLPCDKNWGWTSACASAVKRRYPASYPKRER